MFAPSPAPLKLGSTDLNATAREPTTRIIFSATETKECRRGGKTVPRNAPTFWATPTMPVPWVWNAEANRAISSRIISKVTVKLLPSPMVDLKPAAKALMASPALVIPAPICSPITLPNASTGFIHPWNARKNLVSAGYMPVRMFAPKRPSAACALANAPGSVLPISNATLPAAEVIAFSNCSKLILPSEAILKTSSAVTPSCLPSAW